MADTPFKRSDWNEIIQRVNDVITAPPADTDCDPLPPLDEVDPNHIWSKDDITEVRDALMATCPSISFNAELRLWSQDVLDEIDAAIDQAWCDCEDDCDEDAIRGPDERMTLLNNGPPTVAWNCDGTFETPFVTVEQLINGMQVGDPDISNRSWTLIEQRHFNGGAETEISIAIGSVLCDGTVNAVGKSTRISLQAAGIAVFCGTCGTESCNDAYNDALAKVTSEPTHYYSVYILQINTAHAFCGCP